MRKRHNIFAATLFILGLTYLCVLQEGDGLAFLPIKQIDEVRREVVPAFHPGNSRHKTSFPATLSPSGPISHPISPITSEEGSQVPVDSEPQVLPSNPSDSHVPEPGAQETLHGEHIVSDKGQGSIAVSIVEYDFQEDLNLDLPIDILERYNNHRPLHYTPDGPNTFAYATFMATRNPSTKDPYFLAIHSLIHRILWSPRSRTQKKYPFIVFVANFVTQEQRTLLAGAGAIVRELAPLGWECDAPNVQKRWKDLFSKLNMWAEIEFERILFLDADAFPLTNIDAMFDIAPVRNCIEEKLQIDDFLADKTPVCEPYIFAGVPQDPFSTTYPEINVGSMVFTPSLRMHQRLVQNYHKTDHYNCAMAEQAFLNWQFGADSAYPATKLDRQWGGFFPKDNEKGSLKVVHEKIWAAREGWMKDEWEKGWKEMVE